MKKLLFGLVLLLLPMRVHAQTQFVDADVTTTVHLFIVTAAGAVTTSQTQVVTLQFDLTKPDGTNVTFFCTPSGGGTNDCISEVNSVRLELLASQLSNEGPNLLSWNAGSATCCQGGFASLMVLEAAGTDCWRDGNCATAASITTAVDVEIDKLFTVQAAATFTWPFGPFRSSTDHVTIVGTGTPDCEISTDAPGTFVDAANAESAVSAEGFSELEIASAETSAATDYFIVECTLANADTVQVTFHVQR